MRRCPCCFHSTYVSHPALALDDERTPADTLNIERKTMGDVKRHFATVIDPYKKTCPRCRYKLEHQDIAMCDHCAANQMLQRALEYFAPCTKEFKKTESDYLAIRIGFRPEREKTINQIKKEEEQSGRRPEPANFSKEDEQLAPHMKEVPISDDFFLLSAHKSKQFEKEQSRTIPLVGKKRVDAAEESIKDKRKRERAKKSILDSTLERKIRTSRKENVEASKERKKRKKSVSRSLKDRLFSKDGGTNTSRNKKRDTSKNRRSSEERKKTTLRKKNTESSRDIRTSKERESSASRSTGDTIASNKRKSRVSRKEKAKSLKTRPSSKERQRSPTRKENHASIIPRLSLTDRVKGPSSEGKDKSEKAKRQEIREALKYEKEHKRSTAKKKNQVSKDRLSSEEQIKSTLKREGVDSSKNGSISTEKSLEDEIKLLDKQVEKKSTQQVEDKVKIEESDGVKVNEAVENNLKTEQKKPDIRRRTVDGIEFLSKSLQKMFNFKQNEAYKSASKKEKAKLKTLLFDMKKVQKKENTERTLAPETSESKFEGNKREEDNSALQEKIRSTSVKTPYDEDTSNKREDNADNSNMIKKKSKKKVKLKKTHGRVSLPNQKEIENVKNKLENEVDKPISNEKQIAQEQDSGNKETKKIFELAQMKNMKRDQKKDGDVTLESSSEAEGKNKGRQSKKLLQNQEGIKNYGEIKKQEDALVRTNRRYDKGKKKQRHSHKAHKATLALADKEKKGRTLKKAIKAKIPKRRESFQQINVIEGQAVQRKGRNIQNESLEQIIVQIIKMSNKGTALNVPLPHTSKPGRTSSFGEFNISMEPYEKNKIGAIDKTPALIKILIDYVKDLDYESHARYNLEFVKNKLLAPEFLNTLKQLKFNIPNSDIQLEVESFLNLAEINTQKKIKFKIKNTKVVTFRPEHAKTPKSAVINLIKDMHTFKLMEEPRPPSSTESKHNMEQGDATTNHGTIRYALSDPKFIENGWTQLPVEKVVRKVFLFKMHPAQPEINWLKNLPLQYDTGEKFVDVKDNGHTICFYKNRNIALEHYECEDPSSKQRILIYSDGEPKCGEQMPVCLLAMFDYMGNGVVYDHLGAVRLIYNQYEGRLVDENLGPITHWQWHSLNDPPQFQSIITDTESRKKDPYIIKLGKESRDEVKDKKRKQEKNPEILDIERRRQVKERMEKEKVNSKFCPFPVKIKVVKINDQFSLKILDQTKIYLTFREGINKFKINLGMILDSHEVMDSMVKELGGITNPLEGELPKTESVQNIQLHLNATRRFGRRRKERDNRLRMPLPSLSVDKMTSALARPLILSNPQCSWLS